MLFIYKSLGAHVALQISIQLNDNCRNIMAIHAALQRITQLDSVLANIL